MNQNLTTQYNNWLSILLVQKFLSIHLRQRSSLRFQNNEITRRTRFLKSRYFPIAANIRTGWSRNIIHLVFMRAPVAALKATRGCGNGVSWRVT